MSKNSPVIYIYILLDINSVQIKFKHYLNNGKIVFVYGFMNINSSVHPFIKRQTKIHTAGKINFNTLYDKTCKLN